MKYLVKNYHSSWEPFFKSNSKILSTIDSTLDKSNAVIYPTKSAIFKAFDIPMNSVKVVIIGQDPYHGESQAMGLAFSVNDGCKIPPSLRNIYKEFEADLHISAPKSGDLSKWANEGVLLINATLTVEKDSANSHEKIGWQEFTNSLISYISEVNSGVVFILWGNFAKKKGNLIDISKHKIVESAHPSPLSASRGFLGSRPFSTTNRLLKEIGREEVNWAVINE